MHLVRTETGPYAFLNCTYSDKDVITYQLNMINHSEQNTFIPIKKCEELVYEITSLMPIDIFFRTQCQLFEKQKKLFTLVIDSIWDAEKYLLDPSKIVLDKQYVFINIKSMTVHFIYLPLERYEVPIHKKMKELLLSLVFSLELDHIEGDPRIKKMIGYLQDPTFDMMVFETMLCTFKEEKTVKKQWIKKWFEKEPEEETILLKEDESYPVLEFKEKKVLINKDSFLIGRAKQLVDYAIPYALNMGRVHAEIIREEDQYYIIDVNTKNGTYLNGERIPSQSKQLITKGDCIQIANEIAIFK